MAQKSTVFRAELQLSDMNRGYYKSHTITIARHPSETDERMMMRILAFIVYASDDLTFAQGLTDSNEPDLWEKDLTGSISLWIMVGLPDEKQIRKAAGRALRVVVFSYGSAADLWWSSLSHAAKTDNLSVITIPQAESIELAGLVQRSMQLQCTIQDNDIWISCPEGTVELHLTCLKRHES